MFFGGPSPCCWWWVQSRLGRVSPSTTAQNGVHMTEIKIGYGAPRLHNSTSPLGEDELNDGSLYAEYWIQLPDGTFEIAGVTAGQADIEDAEHYRQTLISQAAALGISDYAPKTMVRLVRRVYRVGPWVEVDPDSLYLPEFEPHEIPGDPA